MVPQSRRTGKRERSGSVGVHIRPGRGVPQDYAEAVRWYRKAAEQGNATAQFSLGFMYDEGQECRRTMPRPSAGTARPPNRETRTLQGNLGIMYGQGRGVPQDYAGGRCAGSARLPNRGNSMLRSKLGVMYNEGHGVPRTTLRHTCGIILRLSQRQWRSLRKKRIG